MKVTVLNIPTNEEVEIARDIERLRKIIILNVEEKLSKILDLFEVVIVGDRLELRVHLSTKEPHGGNIRCGALFHFDLFLTSLLSKIQGLSVSLQRNRLLRKSFSVST